MIFTLVALNFAFWYPIRLYSKVKICIVPFYGPKVEQKWPTTNMIKWDIKLKLLIRANLTWDYLLILNKFRIANASRNHITANRAANQIRKAFPRHQNMFPKRSFLLLSFFQHRKEYLNFARHFNRPCIIKSWMFAKRQLKRRNWFRSAMKRAHQCVITNLLLFRSRLMKYTTLF